MTQTQLGQHNEQNMQGRQKRFRFLAGASSEAANPVSEPATDRLNQFEHQEPASGASVASASKDDEPASGASGASAAKDGKAPHEFQMICGICHE